MSPASPTLNPPAGPLRPFGASTSPSSAFARLAAILTSVAVVGSLLLLAPKAEAAPATGARYVGSANIPVGPHPARDAMSAYVEHAGRNPRGEDTNPNTNPLHEPYAPTTAWGELDRWEAFAGQETITVMAFPPNRRTNWAAMTKGAIGISKNLFSSAPARKDGTKRIPVLGLPLNIKDADGSTLADVAAGKYDANYKAIRDALVVKHPNAVIRLGWESQGGYDWSVDDPDIIKGQGMDARDYIGAYRHIHDLFMKAPGARFEFSYDTEQYGFSNGKGQLLYPGDAYVDYIGLTFYDKAANHDGTLNTFQKRNLRNLDAMGDFANERGKAIYIPELGLLGDANTAKADMTGGDNPIFIEETLKWIDSHNVAFYHYWHRWDVSMKGPYKLTPVYVTQPKWDGNKQYGFTKLDQPRSLYPNAAKAWHATIADLVGSAPAAKPQPTTTTTAPAPTTTAPPQTTTTTAAPAPTTTAPAPTTTTTAPPAPKAAQDPGEGSPVTAPGDKDQPEVTVVPGSNQLDVRWTPNKGSELSQLKYRVGSSPWSWDKPADSTTRLIAGLENDTDHEVAVRTLIGSKWGPWTTVAATPRGTDSVTVPGDRDQPTVTVRARSGAIDISWTPNDGAKLSQVKYRPVGTTWNFEAPSQHTQHVAAVDSNGTYEVAVRTYTGSKWGPWSEATVEIG